MRDLAPWRSGVRFRLFAATGGRLGVDVVRSGPVVSFQDDAVGVAGALHRDEAAFDVAEDEVGLAFEGVSVTATARQAQHHPLAAGDTLLALGVQGFAAGRAHGAGAAGEPAAHPLGREPGAVVHGRQSPSGIAAHPDFHLLPETAAVAAGPLGVRAQLAPVHDDGGDALDDLGRHAADAAGEGRGGQPVPVGARPHAAAGEEHVGEGLAVLAVAGDLGVPEAVGPLGQHLVRDDPRQGAVDQAGQEVADDVPGADGRRVFGVEDASFGRRDANGLEAAVVVGHLRADSALHPEGGVRRGVVEDDVDATLALRRGAGVIYLHLVALNADGDGEPDRLVEAVGVDLVLVDPVGQGCYGFPHGAFGAGADFIRERLDATEAELLDHLQQPRATHVVAPGLGVEVADDLERRPHVGADDAEEILVGLAANEKAGHGHEEPLLVDLARVRAKAPAPNVQSVAAVAEIRDELAVAEDRVITVKSFRWPEVCHGWLVRSTSPGSRVSAGTSRRKWYMLVAIALTWPGVPVTAWATMRPRRSKRPAERSPASRTTLVKEVRIRARACSSTTETSRFQRTSSRIGSSFPCAMPTTSRSGSGPGRSRLLYLDQEQRWIPSPPPPPVPRKRRPDRGGSDRRPVPPGNPRLRAGRSRAHPSGLLAGRPRRLLLRCRAGSRVWGLRLRGARSASPVVRPDLPGHRVAGTPRDRGRPVDRHRLGRARHRVAPPLPRAPGPRSASRTDALPRRLRRRRPTLAGDRGPPLPSLRAPHLLRTSQARPGVRRGCV